MSHADVTFSGIDFEFLAQAGRNADGEVDSVVGNNGERVARSFS